MEKVVIVVVVVTKVVLQSIWSRGIRGAGDKYDDGRERENEEEGRDTNSFSTFLLVCSLMLMVFTLSLL